MIKKQIVIDGNDGAGKDTIALELLKLGLNVKVRGTPTLLTDDPNIFLPIHSDPNVINFILDVPVEISRERLDKAGKNLSERYHTVADLTYYRERFIRVCGSMTNSFLIDASRPVEEVVALIMHRLNR